MNLKTTTRREHLDLPLSKNDGILKAHHYRKKQNTTPSKFLLKKSWNLLLTFSLFFISTLNIQAQCNCNENIGCISNPDLEASCESLNIILVLDESGSIFNAGVEQDVEQAVLDFVNVLNGTAAQLAIVDFSTNSSIVSPYSTIDQNYIDNVIFPYLTHDDVPVPGYIGETYNSVQINSTNWEAALQDVISLGGGGLVIFFTDGNPTAPNGGGNQQANLDDACDEANTLKAGGTHIFMLGVGDVEADNLQSISDNDVYNGSNIRTADYSLTSDFSQLGAFLAGIANETCGGNGTPSLDTEKLRSECLDEQGRVTFTINIQNTGDGVATNVMLTDEIQSGYSLRVIGTEVGTLDVQDATVIWNIGDLPAGASVYIDITVHVNPNGNYNNMAVISADNIEGNFFPSFEGGMPNCCEFSATCVFDPTVEELRGCDVSVLPLPFTNPDDVFSEIGDNPCGDLVLIFSDEVTGTLCPDGLNVARTYRLFDDLDEDGMFDADIEESAICVEFFSIRDMDAPLIQTPPEFPNIACGEAFPELPVLITGDECSGSSEAIASIDPFTPDYCNGYTVTYRFTATDDCNNLNDVTSSFFVEPAPLPTITCPMVDPIACENAANYEPLPASYTNGLPEPCGISGFVDGEVIASDYDECGGTLTVRYIWENPCDDLPVFAPIMQDCIIEVLPAPEPEITCPIISPLVCTEVATYQPVIATYNNELDEPCNISGTVEGEVFISEYDACGGTLTVRYILEDACDDINPSFAPVIQDCTIEILPTPLPTLFCPNVEPLNCADAANFQPPSLAYNNNLPPPCNISGVLNGEIISSDYDECGGPILVHYTLVNSCSDEPPIILDCVVTVMPAPVPTISCPDIEPITCAAAANYQPELATYTNGLAEPCTIEGMIEGEIIASNYNNCGGTLTIRYTLENDCNGKGSNFPPVVQDCTINVLAALAPEITCPILEPISCEDVEGYEPPLADFNNNVEGVCNISGQTSGEVTTTTIENGCIKSLTITYNGFDECENPLQPMTCIVDVFDNEPPVIICPTDLVDLPCNAETPLANITLVNVSDNCTNEMDIVISHIGDMDNGGTACPGNPYIVTRTYQAEDACGNVAPCVQTITFLEDENGPTWVNCIPETTITCEADLANSLSFPDLIDEPCRGLTTTETDTEVVGTPGCPGTQYFYTFMATDPCGRETICTQVYTIAEQELTIECPEELTVECNDPNRETIIQNWLNTASMDITTVCGNSITVTNNYSPNGFEGTCTNSLTGSQVITFDVIDDCGRITSCDVELHVVDTEAPVIIRPAMDEMRPCGPGLETQFQAWLADVGTATAFDGCGGVTWSTLPENPVLNGLNPVEVTFVATDACSNSTQTTASFIPMDNEVPIITIPAQHITIECSDGDIDAIFQDWLDNHGFAEAFDLCGAVTWSIVGETPEIDYRCDGSAMPTYVDFVATDEVGNQALTTGVFDVNDFTPPVFSFVPEDVTLSCDASELNDAFGTPEAVDNCSSVTLSFEDETVGGDCGFHLIRTWTARDDCGNESTASQTINVIDAQAPELFFNHPDLVGLEDGDEVTFNCDDNFVFVASDVTAVDDCSAMVNISLFDFTLLQGNCGIDGFYRKMVCTWTGADGCGNVTDLSITMIITDDEAPLFTSMLEDMTLDCRDTPPITPPTVIDNCSEELTIEFSDLPFIEDCQNGFEITRIWTATDECGNVATMTQIFTMEASPGPVFNLFAANVHIACGEIEDLEAPTCTTDCEDYELNHEDEMISDDCSENMTLLRTWTATDDCGMSSTATQMIVMEADTEAPTLSAFPSEKFILCNETPEFNEVNATDNCSEVTLNFEDVISEDGCDDYYTRIWTASDACGNIVVKTQVIIRVPDSETPEFVNIPENGLVLDCGENADLLMPEVADNCGVDRLTKEDEIIEGDCTDTYTILRTWTAIDFCGNASSVQRSFVVEIDNTAPVFLEVPESYTIGCGDVPVFGTPRFVDYCSETELSTTDETIIGTCNGSGYSRTKTWTITDACGNSQTASQTIEVEEDIIAPVMTGLEDYEVDCDGLESSLSTPNISDNCSEVTVEYEDTVGEGTCLSGYEIERTWTAMDACGNTTVHTQSIQVTSLIGTTGIIDGTSNQGKTDVNNQRLSLPTTKRPVTSFKIYPNPVQQELFLELENNEVEIGLISIFTITGKLVKEVKMENLSNRQAINVQDLNNGLYILTIRLDGTQYQAKFTKTQ